MFHTFSNWQFRQVSAESPSEWKPSCSGPCVEIYSDLCLRDIIKDPLLDCNERDVQWVGLQDWEYKSFFELSKESKVLTHQKLKIHGLDTFATIYINGHEILLTDNMFRTYLVDVEKNYLNFGSSNTLRIVFKSAVLVGRALEERYGKLACSNGETSRVYVRKAQYQYGWDWGPRLPSCGIYRPLEFIQSKDYLGTQIRVDVDKDLNAHIKISSVVHLKTDSTIKVDCVDPNGKKVSVTKRFVAGLPVTFRWICDKPELWYPHGYGKQSFYEFEISAGTQTLKKKIGFRRVELVEEKFENEPSSESFVDVSQDTEVQSLNLKENTNGTSFYFRINNIPIYISGSSWIPIHAHKVGLAKEEYSKLLGLALDGNQNMVRVWGGGVYEPDEFYEECDRLGLMVWQDFMFACGQYPGHDEFVDSVALEAEDQIKRLVDHCSVVILAGNNEDYQMAEGLGWNPNGDDTVFPARKIYEETLPRIVKKHTSIPYRFGSPWGGKTSNDPSVGDIHQWNVWHGSQEKYQNWGELGGRFVSEFGMESLPSFSAMGVSKPREQYPQSEAVDHHNKATGFESRLSKYVFENLRVSSLDMEYWIYATQLMHAECIGTAFRIWRRDWKANKERYSGGALVWQLNDCWGATSWSVIDFAKRPKLAYYAIKRESQPVVIGIHRNQEKIYDGHAVPPHDYCPVEYSVDIWASNTTLEEINGTINVELYDLVEGTRESMPDQRVVVLANGSTEIVSRMVVSKDVVVHARLVSGSSEVAESSDWPQPLKYYKFPGVRIELQPSLNGYVLSTNKPAKGVEIYADQCLLLSDNGFDLFPGHDKEIYATGLPSEIRHYA